MRQLQAGKEPSPREHRAAQECRRPDELVVELARIGRSADQPEHRSARGRGTPEKNARESAATAAKDEPDEAGDAELNPRIHSGGRAEALKVDNQRWDKE